MQFDQFEVKDFVGNYLKNKHFKSLTPIRKQVLINIKKNNNMLCQSKTGSGKTLAFLIPVFNKLDINSNTCQAVICAPTRELAMQIYNVASDVASYSNKKIDIRVYAGGTNRLDEIERLESKTPQIVIGTPGKIVDLAIKTNALPIYSAKFFIVDEADMCFDSGFIHDLDDINKVIKDKKTLVFSATINDNLKNSLSKYLHTKLIIKIDEKELQNLNIEHWLLPVKTNNKLQVLNNIFEIINPYLALVFANTKERVDMVAENLKNMGYKVAVIHGGLEMRERKRIMKQIHDLKYQYIVASDIAARGIDIEGVSHIINFDLPSDYEFYIHRTGRTGRANMSGLAISIYDFDNEEYIKKIEKKGIKFKYMDIKNKEFVEKRARK